MTAAGNRAARGPATNPVLWLAVVLAVKSLVVGWAVDGFSAPAVAVAASLAAGALLAAPVLLTRGWLRLWAALAVDAAISGVLVADLMFASWYGGLVPLPMVGQGGQVGAVDSSLASTFSGWFGLLFLDVVAGLVAVVAITGAARDRRRPRPSWRRRPGRAAVAVAAAGVVLTACAAATGAVGDRYATKQLARSVGPAGYHLIDGAVSASRWTPHRTAVTGLAPWAQARWDKVGTSTLSGTAAGSNVLVIQMEAMSSFLVGREVGGREVTPTLNRLAGGEAVYFDHYYPQIAMGNTSDAELLSLTSRHPMPAGSAFIRRADAPYPSALPTVLADAGYDQAHAFHGYTRSYYNRGPMYESFGFDAFHAGDEYQPDSRVGLGLGDREFFAQTVPRLATLPSPWLGFAVTLSGHHPYEVPPADQVLDVPAGEFTPEFTAYLQAQAYADLALGEFLDDLEATGMLEDTTVVVYGDHWGQGWTDADVERLTGRDSTGLVDSFDDTRVPLLIRLPGGLHGTVVSDVLGQVDLEPTLLDLLGVETDAVMFGRTALAGGDLVALRFYQPQGSFVSDDLVFQAGPDGDLAGGACFAHESGKRLDTSRCRAGFEDATWRLRASDAVMDGTAPTLR